MGDKDRKRESHGAKNEKAKKKVTRGAITEEDIGWLNPKERWADKGCEDYVTSSSSCTPVLAAAPPGPR